VGRVRAVGKSLISGAIPPGGVKVSAVDPNGRRPAGSRNGKILKLLAVAGAWVCVPPVGAEGALTGAGSSLVGMAGDGRVCPIGAVSGTVSTGGGGGICGRGNSATPAVGSGTSIGFVVGLAVPPRGSGKSIGGAGGVFDPRRFLARSRGVSAPLERRPRPRPRRRRPGLISGKAISGNASGTGLGFCGGGASLGGIVMPPKPGPTNGGIPLAISSKTSLMGRPS